MLRKISLALCAFGLIGLLLSDVAAARAGFGGSGFHGGGFHGGLGGVGFRHGGFAGGGGWRGRDWRGGAAWRGAAYGAMGLALGLGLASSSYYGYPYGDEDDYPSGYGEYALYGPWARNNYYFGGCYLARQRFWTAYGWRLRVVQVCD